jgi:ankyrin repeat protein
MARYITKRIGATILKLLENLSIWELVVTLRMQREKRALHVSAETGSLKVAKLIVEGQEMSYGENDLEYTVVLDRAITKLNRLNLRDKDGNTPLHFAAEAGSTKILDYLLSAGSDLGSLNLRGEYPFTLAARYGRNDSVELLLQRHCVVKCDDIMTSAMTAAIMAGHVDTSALLLRSGVPVSGGEKEKPIHAAWRTGHMDVVSLLLQHGAIINCRTDSGNTALHLASEAGHLSLVKYLVELQRDQMETPNFENETSLHLASRNGREYLVKYFVENSCSINAISANSSACLNVACELDITQLWNIY